MSTPEHTRICCALCGQPCDPGRILCPECAPVTIPPARPEEKTLEQMTREEIFELEVCGVTIGPSGLWMFME